MPRWPARNRNRYHRWLAGALFALASMAADAASPELTITAGGRTQRYTSDALLALPSLATITVPADVAYRRPMTYRAIPLAALLQGVPREDSVRFASADGFAATIPAAALLAAGDDAARAYLAIEPPAARWPALKAGSPATAGPFYLVWVNPEKSRIVPEQWPYQVAAVEDVAPITTRFPVLLPATTVPSNDPIRHGLVVFTTNCIVCHTLNLAGDAKIGPDLNVPFSPTEYFREEYLRRLVRSPQSVRTWADSKMPGFDARAISDRDLDDLVAYLYYMAKRKVELSATR
jgi:mono/diheme cytochrome c family protein